MDPVKKEAEATVDADKIEKTAEELATDQKKAEEDKAKKDEFEKENDVVPSGKYNESIRKQRELELKNRELEKKLQDQGSNIKPVKKEVIEEEQEEDEDDEDFFGEKKKPVKNEIDLEVIEPISREVKELRERIDQRDASDKEKQRSTFFKAHPEYLTDAVKWQELLDEMDNSLNPHSKDGYYKQLTKAHRLISGDSVVQHTEIDKKKAEMAAELAGKGDGSQKAPDNSKPELDERSLRLANKMPKGYEFKKKE